MVTKKDEAQTTEVATTEQDALQGMIIAPAEDGANLPEHVRNSTGAGNDNVDASDMLIPRIKLLQSLSPELDTTKAAYLPGAKSGQFLNTNTQELFDELYLVNLFYEHMYCVFKKRKLGGGFKGAFPSLDAANAAIEEMCQSDDELMPQMLETIETARHTLLTINPRTGKMEPAVIDMTSTKLQVSRAWNTNINRYGGDRFAAIWKMTSASVTNSKGTFFNLNVSFVGYLNDELYAGAKEKYQQIRGAIDSGNVTHGDEDESEAAKQA